MGFLSTTSKLCSALILVAINCLLLAGGIIIVVASHHAKGTGWVDVIDTYWSSTDTVLNALQITGYVIIALAVLGSVAACCRWRLGLLVYAIVVFIVLIAFGAIAGVTFAARSTSQDWKGKTYPAADAEATIKVEFDKAYCLAQGEYLCNEISVSDAAAIFYPEFANSSVLSSFSSLKGINSMCSAFSTLVPSLTTVCKGCEAAKQFENFTDVLSWANDKCPRTSSTLLWCGNYFATSNDSLVTTGTAPYVHCRTEFLDLVSSSALTLGTGSIIIACGALLVLVFTCCLRRQERRDAGYENVEYGNTPHGVQNGTPQTQQPFVGTNTMHSKV